MRMRLAAAGLSLATLAGALQAQEAGGAMAANAPVTTIAQTVAGSPTHATLAMGLEAAGLTETLAGAGPCTLLAPTHDVFAAPPEGLIDEMLLPENKEALSTSLLCHVIDGQLVGGDLARMEAAGTAGPEGVVLDTLGGCKLTIQDTPEGGVTVTDENGTVTHVVVHVIDAIMGPAGM